MRPPPQIPKGQETDSVPATSMPSPSSLLPAPLDHRGPMMEVPVATAMGGAGVVGRDLAL